MSWALKVATVRGIPIRVHVSFLLILLWAGWTGIAGGRGDGWLANAGFMMLFVLLLFICVVLHELGHSLVAQAFGVKVHDITLWPIGGVARLANMPHRPLHEFLITAAGPAVNLVLAIVLALLAALLIGPDRLLTAILTGRGLTRLITAQTAESLALLLALQNLLLAVFNLIPAFPMDGGRLLRSFMAGFLPFRTATRAASYVGQVIALVLIALSFLSPGNFFLTLIGVFVFLGAWQERSQVTLTQSLAGLTVGRAMQPLGMQLPASGTIADAIQRAAASPQSAYAVVDNGRLVGLLTRRALLRMGGKVKGGVLADASRTLGSQPLGPILQVPPDRPLLEAYAQIGPDQAAVVVDAGRGAALGLISRADIARLAEALEILRTS